MATLPSPWRSPKGEAQYREAYEAVLDLSPVPYEHRHVTGIYGRTAITGPANACDHAGGYDSDRPGGFGSKDLWRVEVKDLVLATARGSP